MVDFFYFLVLHEDWGKSMLTYNEMINKRVKKIFITLLAIISILLILEITALAEGSIDLKVVPGFNGDYKNSDLVPINVTIDNNSNEDIEGTLFVEAGVNQNQGKYFEEVTVARNTSKEITLLIPGDGLYTQTKVKFKSEDKELAQAGIGGRRYSPNSYFIGVLSADKDTGNYIALAMNSNNIQSNLISLTEDNIYDSSKYISGLDMIIINNYSLDNFNEDQIQSIIDWTKAGGTLILSGGSSYHKIANEFAEISPIEYLGTTEISQLTSIEDKIGKDLDINDNLTISNSSVKEGQVVFEENNTPLFVIDEVEFGKVLYVAYDLAEEPLASWSGNQQLWGFLLNLLEYTLAYRNINTFDSYQWPLENASLRIPSLQLLELNTMLIIFIIYILLIGPILYFILRKKKKQILGWIVIPTMAIFIAIVIFQISSINRGSNIMTHNVSYLDMTKGNQGRLITVSSIFVPKGGDYSLVYNNVDSLLTNNTNGYYPQNQSNKEAWISINGDGLEIEYKNIAYQSYESTYFSSTVKDIGKIDSQLSYSDGKITGLVTNNSNYQIRDAKALIGLNIADIGDFAPGESKELSISYSPSNIRTTRASQEVLLPNHLKQDPERFMSREFTMLEIINNETYNKPNYSTHITFIGWTEEPLVDFQIPGKYHDDYNLTLIKDYLDVIPNETGEVFYFPESFQPSLVDNTGKFNTSIDGYYFSAGSLTFEFNLNDELKNTDIDKIYFYVWSNSGTVVNKKIYNWSTEQYQSFNEIMINSILENENINDYISKDNKIRIEISHNYTYDIDLAPPAIGIEGRVKQ